MRKLIWAATTAFFCASATGALAISSGSPSAAAHARIERDIGVDLYKHGKYEQAAAYLAAALDEFPDDVGVLKYLATAHRMMAKTRTGEAHDGELQLANTYYRRALDEDPNDKDVLEFLGELYLEMDDPDAAREKLKALEARCPNGCQQRDMLASSIAAYKPAASPDAKTKPEALEPNSTQ
ncbi:MAG TPA: tetratricopeptide repeat protein [Rhizomicrobium sp.]|jgi:tetratricopeptide (TPR) repeat protein|nr:tetratricopeptide repeat protein [Rhizomicrobium sp.]